MSLPPSVETKISKWFHLSDDALRQIKASMRAEFELGLRDEEAAAIKMLITYVRELSRGDETGSYLALDLGGTHFRVLLVSLNGDGSEPRVTSVTHDIPQAMLVTQNGRELFDYIALRLLEFVKQYKLKRRRISLGFTFSFPCKQYGLTQSILVKWCKGFSVGGVVGTDVVRQLKDALKRQLAGLVEAYIDVVAVINDTTGTLVACANKNKDCRIGLIVGTGFNACYMESLDKCEKWPANYTNPKQVIVNCEWGAMGDHKDRRALDKFRNELDEQIDRESVNPLNQCYEKMVAGMYVGELLRLAMLSLCESKLLLTGGDGGGGGSGGLSQMGSVTSTLATPSTGTLDSQAFKSAASLGQNSSRLGLRPLCAAKKVSPRSSSSIETKSVGSKSAKKERGPKRARPAESVLSSPGSSVTSTTAPASDAPPSSAADAKQKLHRKDVFNGKHLSMLAKDELTGNFEEATKMLNELQITTYSQADLAIIVRLGAAIMQRSASLVACGISALLERMRRKFTVVGYDGSVIKYHPYFLKRVVEKTSQLTPAELRFEFVQSHDGSGIGAAVVAAALHKERRPLYVVKPGRLYEMHLLRSQQQQSQLSSSDKPGATPTPALPLPGTERVTGSASPSSSSTTASGVSSPRSPGKSAGRKSDGSPRGQQAGATQK